MDRIQVQAGPGQPGCTELGGIVIGRLKPPDGTDGTRRDVRTDGTDGDGTGRPEVTRGAA